MSVKYKVLFAVKLLCEYYSNLQCKDFAIVPSAETSRLIKDHKMLLRKTGDKLVVLVRVDQDDRPSSLIDPDTKFVFYLHLRNPDFIHIANINLNKLQGKRFYFSNRSANACKEDLYLTTPIRDFNSKLTYQPGDLVRTGAQVAECIRFTEGKNAVTDKKYWIIKGAYQYASPTDMLTIISPVNTFRVSSYTNSFIIKAFGWNKFTNKYDQEVILNKNRITIESGLVNEVQLDLQELKTGRYKIVINNDVYEVCIDGNALYENAFGVIEIFNQSNGSSHFALLDSDGKVKEKQVDDKSEYLTYSIRFADRKDNWKYISSAATIRSIKNRNKAFAFDSKSDTLATSDFFKYYMPLKQSEKQDLLDIDLLRLI